MRRSKLRWIALLLSLTSSTAGCYSWRPATVAAGNEPPAASARTVRLNMVGGARIELRDLHVSGDSLIGQAGKPSVRTALPRADVLSIDERRLHPGRTAVAAIGVAAATALVVLVAIVASEGVPLGY